MKAYRVAWLTVAVLLGGCGLLSAFAGLGPAVVPLGLVGAIAGCATRHAVRAFKDSEPDEPGTSELVQAGGLGACLALATGGIGWLVGTPGIFLLLIVCAASPWLIGSLAAWKSAPAQQMSEFDFARWSDDDVDSYDPSDVAEEIIVDPTTLSDLELATAWRRSFVRVDAARSSAQRAMLADLRGKYLDELERRDPGGFARWLSNARAASDPGRYLSDRSQRSGLEPRRPPSEDGE